MNSSEFVNKIESELSEEFKLIDKIAEFNQKKVLEAFYKNKIGEEHFYTVTGYGHDDLGREALDNVFKDAFNTEAAIVRPHFVSGTHTLSCVLFGLLHSGDHLLSIAGAPYDTMEEVIGTRKNDEYHESSLIGHGVEYDEVPLKDEFEVDFEKIPSFIKPNTKMVLIQKSRGYSLRKSLSLDDIERIVKIVKNTNPNIICFVDNCYGEFTDIKEPVEVGADIMAGSLIKNPGGGIVEAGGYIAGKKRLVEFCARRLTAPGIGSEGGAMFNTTRIILQGFFMAPSIVAGALKGAILSAKVFEEKGFITHPHSSEKRVDLIQTIKFTKGEEQEKFCKALQRYSPVESYLTPIPDVVPGYDCKLIMAGGSFIEGSTIELSADGPVRPPYAIYMQGGLSYYHVKIALIGILDELAKND
ncbi:MAG: methionine gamma-lyase family protein [bacterium]|nr:methionine gamma-lyase family protein [bacterium]